MNNVGKLKKFIKFLCKKYETDNILKSYGGFPWSLISESGIDFGDAKAQLAAVDMLLHQGLIEAVDLQGTRREGVKRIRPSTKIRPSYQGLQDRQQDWPKIVSAVAEGVTKGIIRGFTKT